MRELEKALRGNKILIFLDLEGAQFSHEMIEIGAYKVVLKDDLTVKKIFKPYKAYVRAKSRVGKVVTELTGITDEKIEKEGIPYRVALNGLIKYVGNKDYHRCLFVTFGSFDKTIFQASGEHNKDASMDETRFITHHMFDFAEFLSRFVRDQNGNPYSLKNCLKLFGVEFEGREHDAACDALNLIDLYKAFLENPQIVKEEYKKVIARNHHLPGPVAMVMNKLNKGLTVGPEEYDYYVEEFLK